MLTTNVNTDYSPPTNQATAAESNFWGEDGFSFDDLLDIVNPLQHIPIISHFYQELTGDTISNGAQIAGGGLYGGVAGVVSSFFNATIKETTGETLFEHASSFITTPESEPITQLASDTTNESPLARLQRHNVEQLTSSFNDSSKIHSQLGHTAYQRPLEQFQKTGDITTLSADNIKHDLNRSFLDILS